jgi:UDP-N-acetylmuramyl tripeptide synthase
LHMKRRLLVAICIGKLVRGLSRLVGNGGSALPGLVVEKVMPQFINEVLGSLDGGVIVVVGTNGKTTTTKIISELLTSQGLRVLTNASGSNFMRGIIATIISDYKLKDRALHKDIAVLELDEAYGKLFVERVKPQYVVALNVMRDQLDRFGELAVTTKMLASILQAATRGCVINGDEPELVSIGDHLKVPVAYYGVKPGLRQHFPTDAELMKVFTATPPKSHRTQLTVMLNDFQGQQVSYRIGGHIFETHLKLKGQYNFHNAAAALTIANMVMPKVNVDDWLQSLKHVEPAFGRGETIKVGEHWLELILVKNPSSFRQGLASHTAEALTMIAINDNHADGRDVSWLWDVDFSGYSPHIYLASGIRANDLALRLKYDNIEVSRVETNLEVALKSLLAEPSALPRRIFCTYTAMLAIRAILKKSSIMEPGL